jgi:hypothetical protein
VADLNAMPLYEFHNEEFGANIAVPRKVEDRDKPLVFTRVTVPSTIVIHGFEPSEAEAFDTTILKQFHRKEEKEGSRFQCGEFSKRQIKDAWTNPVRENGHHG